MISCICANKNESEIRKLIREGNDTLQKLQKFNIGVQCKLCIPYVEEYIKQELSKEKL
jgi:bacterioferritin-associated ferredoxin